MSSIFSLISPESIIDTYRSVRAKLNGYDTIIFSAMKNVDNRFIEPIDSSQYQDKHREIENILEFADMINGYKTGCCLFEKIWTRCNASGGFPGVSAADILSLIKFQTSNSDIFIKLTDDVRWAVSTNVFLGQMHSTEIRIEQIDHVNNWVEIVPKYIVEYILNAINAYKQGMYIVAAALLSIAVEGTLRDVLDKKGYSFDPSATNVDIFHYTDASVSVSGNSYTIVFREVLPKQPSDFITVCSGSTSVDIKVKRAINKRKNRTDLNIICPDVFLDYWSKDTIQTARQKTVGGLGEALRIAREVECFITPLDLPIDFDDVITGVRNNLIHLSGNSLNQQLRILNITLRDFLSSDRRVYALLTKISRFINDQYIQLKRDGH